ncbi:MAG: SLBB domain-containing protein [Breznakibacter sp.]
MKFLFTLLFLLPLGFVIAQTLPAELSSVDLKTVRVDDLTDDQIRSIADKLEERSMTIDQVESIALGRGMSKLEFNKLRQRLTLLPVSETTKKKELKKDSIAAQKKLDEFNKRLPFDILKERDSSRVFGRYLFLNPDISFEPNLNIPTPKNYVLAAGDQIDVNVWGNSQFSYQFKLDSHGEVIVPYVGVINLSGQTIESATGKLKAELSKIYSGLVAAQPNTFLSVNLSEVRSIKVNILGQVSVPGSFTLPGFATVFNALYAAGGPNDKGSFRNIKVVRNGKAITTIDLYSLLTKGELENDIRLQDQDVIFVDNYLCHVSAEGSFRQAGIFELKKGETLNDLLHYSGGLEASAYKNLLSVVRKTGKQNRMMDVEETFFGSFALQDGDMVTAGKALELFDNRVEVKGAVYRPGMYEQTEELTLAGLIAKVEGFRGDAFLQKVTVYRQKDDFSQEAFSLDCSGAIPEFSLIREDVVYVPSIFDLREEWGVNVEGEVNKPGRLPFIENTTIADIIVLAGGLKESASYARIEVARRMKDPFSEAYAKESAKLFTFSILPNLLLPDEAKRFRLEPFDQVIIRRSPAYSQPQTIMVEGETFFPGQYALLDKQEYISDIIKRAGGLTPYAYPEGARLEREIKQKRDKEIKEQLVEHIRSASKKGSEEDDSLLIMEDKPIIVPLDLGLILSHPKSERDFVLMPGDKITIPTRPETVTVSGMVWQPSLRKYEKSLSLKKYINASGGFAPNAKKNKTYVIYANGSIKTSKRIFFITDYPLVKPGAEIMVPAKPEKQKLTTGEAVSIASALSSVALVVVSIITLTK